MSSRNSNDRSSVFGGTLAELVTAVQAADLSEVQKRDRISAIRTVAKALGARAEEIPFNVKLLRRRLEEVQPEALGMSQARWNNVRALLNRALEFKGGLMPSAQRNPISPAWRNLALGLPRSARLRLSALLRFLSGRGIEPSHITLAELEAFREAIVENRLRATPEKTWDGIVWTWNKYSKVLAGWPRIIIPREDRRTIYVRPWKDFPTSLKMDVDAYLKVLAGEIIDEEGPLRALRPSTLRNREYQARVAASALVASGTDPKAVRALADVTRLEPMKLILNLVLSRGSGQHLAGAFNLANFLKSAAQHWVKVDELELTKIRKIVSKLSPRKKGLTEKNRRRLIPFNDSEVVRRFLDLPYRLAREVRAESEKTSVSAVTAQLAVAIAILQAIPMRVANLAALDLEKHLVPRGRRIYVLIPGEEVKNDQPYQMELPKEVADLIAWYCLEYRDLLMDRPTTALFPGEGGKSKRPATLGVQISKRVEQYLGLPINPHLFRHIAAKLYLDRRPGEYALVSRLLNHQSLATTMRAYTGAETVSAAQHFQTLVAGIRNGGAEPGRRKAAR